MGLSETAKAAKGTHSQAIDWHSAFQALQARRDLKKGGQDRLGLTGDAIGQQIQKTKKDHISAKQDDGGHGADNGCFKAEEEFLETMSLGIRTHIVIRISVFFRIGAV